MSPTKQVTGKNVATLSPAQRDRTTVPLPAVSPAPGAAEKPAALLTQSDALVPVSVLHVSDEARNHIADEAAASVANALFIGFNSSKARTDMFEKLMTFRRMFPAHADVQSILGPDAFDLIGRTPEYAAAAEALYGEAKTTLIGKLRREVGRDLAEQVATTQINNLKQNLKNDIRKEAEALAQRQPNPALFMLGHGFERRANVKTQAIGEGQSLKITRQGEDGPITGWELVSKQKEVGKGQKPGPKATEDDAAAQVTKLLSAAGVTVGDPIAILNLTVDMLNGAAQLLRAPDTKTNLDARNALRKSLLSASKNALSALAGLEAAPAEVPAAK